MEVTSLSLLPATPELEKSGEFCLLNPLTSLGRSQPVFCALQYLDTYDFHVLSFTTPLGTVENLNILIEQYGRYRFSYENEGMMTRLCYNDKEPEESVYHVYMRTDLPVLKNEKYPPGMNALSHYELNESLNKLVEMADLVERMAFKKQDIDIEIAQKNTPLNRNEKLRQENISAQLSGKWQRSWNPEFVELLHSFDTVSDLKAVWKMNHEHNFIRFLGREKQTDASLVYLAKDIQMSEQQALGKYFDDAVNYRKSTV